MIFFSVFWSAFAPIALVILWLIADELTHHHHGANGALEVRHHHGDCAQASSSIGRDHPSHAGEGQRRLAPLRGLEPFSSSRRAL
jgi:hypothetical protein